MSTDQKWDAAGYARHARFVADLGAPLVDLLDPQPGERILDLGCGDGILTERIAALGADVVGADSSPELVASARARGLKVDVIDGHRLAYDGEFNAVFSNAALHWMTQPDDVLAGVHRALVPGGRFVAEMGGYGNVASIVTAIVAVLRARDGVTPTLPWYFPSVEEYRERLEAHGFVVETITLTPRPTPLPTGIEGWLETFAVSFLAWRALDERDAIVKELVAVLTPALRDFRGRWSADYVRLRFRAQLR